VIGHNAADAIRDIINISMRESLQGHRNARHAAVFAMYHGLDNTGRPTRTPATFSEIAEVMGCNRITTTQMYYRGAVPIFAKLSDDLVTALKHCTAANE
jgi:hypothetical protein